MHFYTSNDKQFWKFLSLKNGLLSFLTRDHIKPNHIKLDDKKNNIYLEKFTILGKNIIEKRK